jgi:hypothetical protein
VRSLSITAYALSAECALSPKLRGSINRLSSAELYGERTLALNMTSQGGQSKPSVGFISMGHMGSTMAKRLIEVGYPLTIYDRTKERAQEIAQQGIAVAQTPKVLAAQCEVVMLCVTDDEAQRQLILGPDGALAGVRSPCDVALCGRGRLWAGSPDPAGLLRLSTPRQTLLAGRHLPDRTHTGLRV